MKEIQLLILSFLLGFQLSGQDFKGQVLSKETQKPIPYANIAVVDSYQGTASDENGFFDLSLKKVEPTAMLRISAIGFAERQISIQDFTKICQEKEGKFFLKTTVKGLPEITIRSKKLKERKAGLRTKSAAFQEGFFVEEAQLGWEYGARIKIKQPSLLKKIGANIQYCSHDSMFYQVNIYRMNGDGVGENILPEPVYLKFTKSDIKNSVYTDIDYLNIEVKEDILVTLEAVKIPKNKSYGIMLKASPRYFTYQRRNLGKWKVERIGPAIFAVIEHE